jgi:ribosomal protein S12
MALRLEKAVKTGQTFQTSVSSHEIGKVTEAVSTHRKTPEDAIVKMCKVELSEHYPDQQ